MGRAPGDDGAGTGRRRRPEGASPSSRRSAPRSKPPKAAHRKVSRLRAHSIWACPLLSSWTVSWVCCLGADPPDSSRCATTLHLPTAEPSNSVVCKVVELLVNATEDETVARAGELRDPCGHRLTQCSGAAVQHDRWIERGRFLCRCGWRPPCTCQVPADDCPGDKGAAECSPPPADAAQLRMYIQGAAAGCICNISFSTELKAMVVESGVLAAKPGQ